MGGELGNLRVVDVVSGEVDGIEKHGRRALCVSVRGAVDGIGKRGARGIAMGRLASRKSMNAKAL